MNRPPIPEAVKREVRQKCAFGCIICGIPVFQYDHVIPYSEVGEHRTENLVLLCPTHHTLKTNGTISINTIKNTVPRNRSRQYVGPYNFFIGKKRPEIIVGGNVFSCLFDAASSYFNAVEVCGTPVVRITEIDQSAAFDILMTDTLGQTVFEVCQGEVTFSVDVWDYDYRGPTIVIRSAPFKILFEMEITNAIEIRKGTFCKPPIKLSITEHSCSISPSDIGFSGNEIHVDTNTRNFGLSVDCKGHFIY